MALGSTQPLTEMSTRLFPGGKGGRCVGLTNLPPSCAVVMKSGNLNFLEPSGPLQACNGTALPLLATNDMRRKYALNFAVSIPSNIPSGFITSVLRPSIWPLFRGCPPCFQEISGTVTQISGTVTQISGTVTQISRTVTQISGTVTQISGTVTQISGTVTQISGTVTQISRTVTQISGTVTQICP